MRVVPDKDLIPVTLSPVTREVRNPERDQKIVNDARTAIADGQPIIHLPFTTPQPNHINLAGDNEDSSEDSPD